MNNQPWGTEDGELLQNLRKKAGIDALVFARANTISAVQLQELESGEGRSFYNPLIKRNTGIKLLKKLGYEYPVTAMQVTKPASDALIAAPAPEVDKVVEPIVSSAVNPKSFPNPFVTHPFLLTGSLLSIGLLGFLTLQQLDASPTDTPRPAVLQSERIQPNGSTSAPQDTQALPNLTSSSVPEAMPKTSNFEPSGVAANPAADRNQLGSVKCEDRHRKNSKSHTPINPLKPGNYIYIEARADSELCVLDSENKLFVISLKAGMNQTVNGLAPFLLHTSNWQGLQVFFQGRPVRPDHGDSAHLLLKSLPL